MAQYSSKRKSVYFHPEAQKELSRLPNKVKDDFAILIIKLEEDGFLNQPRAKKLIGTDLFELRVKRQGQWRAFYKYSFDNKIIILKFIQKKTQKTRKQDIQNSIRRFNQLLL